MIPTTKMSYYIKYMSVNYVQYNHNKIHCLHVKPVLCVGMNGNIEENYEEIPAAAAAASQSRSSSSNSIKLEDTFKVNLPFKTLQNITVKCGPLWRKEKVVFLDQWRKSWTGLYGHFLLMYYTQRDVRPYDHVNVQGFVARPAPNCNKDLKRKDATFEIVCPGKRDYQVHHTTLLIYFCCSTGLQVGPTIYGGAPTEHISLLPVRLIGKEYPVPRDISIQWSLNYGTFYISKF